MTFRRPHEYFQDAVYCYDQMLQAQAALEKFEEEALRLANYDKIAAAKVYLSRKDNDAGWTYNNLCANRDMWMHRAALAAAMTTAGKVIYQ